jgi:hypothetical protein
MNSNEQKKNDINIKYVLKWAKWKAKWINEQVIDGIKVKGKKLNAQIKVSN